MRRVLLRSRKDPLEVVGPGEAIERNVFGNNAGNLIFSQASHKTLQTAGTEVVANGFRANAADADQINEEYDAFVIPLANAFRRTFQSQLGLLTDLIEKLRIPVVVLGVGAQSDLDYDLERMSPINDSVKRFVSAVLDRSASIGVRGEFTQSYLNGLGFKDVEIIGCPSMFMYGDQINVTKRVDELTWDSAVAVNASRSALGAGDVGGIVTANSERYRNMRYFAQETKDLSLLYWGDSSEVNDKHNPMPIHRTHPLFREDKVRVYLDPATWINDLRAYDFAFGTRIHGNIAALLAGIPGFVLCHDSRTLELCRYFDIPHRPIRDLEADVDAAELYAEADYKAMHEGHAERFARFTSFLDENGLDHVHNPGEDGGEAFEARIQATAYPPGVDAWTSSEEGVSARIGWLKQRQADSDMKAAELAKQVRELEKLTSKTVKGLEKRLSRMEAASQASLPRRIRRTGGRALRKLGLRR